MQLNFAYALSQVNFHQLILTKLILTKRMGIGNLSKEEQLLRGSFLLIFCLFINT